VLSDTEGHHAFAATLDEHNANVAAAREAGILG
jgi:cell division protein YceG involved in septum cleavage